MSSRLKAKLKNKIRPRQYFKAAYYYLDEPHRIVPPASVPDWEDAPGPESTGEESGAITVPKFASHCTSHHADSDAGFAKEYTDIQKYCSKQIKATSEHSSHVDNKHKNRYLNIVACKTITSIFFMSRSFLREKSFIFR